MGPVSERDMAYQMDCYFRQSWVDKRLEFDAGEIETLRVSITFLEKIWKPDTHFLNGKQSYLHTVTSPNKLLRVNKDGRILYSMRYTRFFQFIQKIPYYSIPPVYSFTLWGISLEMFSLDWS